MHSQKLDGILQYLEDRYEYENPSGIFNKEDGLLLMSKMEFHNKRIDMIVVCLLASFLTLFAGVTVTFLSSTH